jgi:hypothetical protein
MRRFATLVASVALVAAGSASSASAQPTVQVLDRSPLVLHAVGFHPLEHVTVTALTGNEKVVRHVVANVRGGLLIRFGFEAGGCDGAYLVRLAGARSGVVAVKFPLGDCPSLSP